jgi:GGDEF domain-containing protein
VRRCEPALTFRPCAADRKGVNSDQSKALLTLASGYSQSFAEAVEAALATLDELIPGVLLLGRFDFEEGVCRVIDARGDVIGGVERGTTLPLATNGTADAERSNGDRPPEAATAETLDPDFLRSLSAQSWLALPLETRNGNLVGALCALSDRVESYHSGHLALLAIGARLLSHEWESLEDRTELRRLRERLQDDQLNDSETGIRTRESFLDVLEREWRLAKRGTLQSVALAIHVEVEGVQKGPGGAIGALGFKDAVAVLTATSRVTDHVGRIGERALGVVLVGCPGLENAQAFVGRFTSALQRATQARTFSVRASVGMQDLAKASSPAKAVELAEKSAGKLSKRGRRRGRKKLEARR